LFTVEGVACSDGFSFDVLLH